MNRTTMWDAKSAFRKRIPHPVSPLSAFDATSLRLLHDYVQIMHPFVMLKTVFLTAGSTRILCLNFSSFGEGVRELSFPIES